jgi:hypothetical protein
VVVVTKTRVWVRVRVRMRMRAWMWVWVRRRRQRQRQAWRISRKQDGAAAAASWQYGARAAMGAERRHARRRAMMVMAWRRQAIRIVERPFPNGY